jgi:hypothetical protein
VDKVPRRRRRRDERQRRALRRRLGVCVGGGAFVEVVRVEVVRRGANGEIERLAVARDARVVRPRGRDLAAVPAETVSPALKIRLCEPLLLAPVPVDAVEIRLSTSVSAVLCDGASAAAAAAAAAKAPPLPMSGGAAWSSPPNPGGAALLGKLSFLLYCAAPASYARAASTSLSCKPK